MQHNQKIPTIYRFSEFQIDTVEETLRRRGERLSINRRTFQVLRLLVERPGEIVTKQEFFDTVWADTFVEDNSLTVAMTALRKALGDNPKQPTFIENLPRRGYRFIANVETVSDHLIPAPISEPTNLSSLGRRGVWIATVFLLVFATVGLAYWNSSRATVASTNDSAAIYALAVLPFENSNGETQYLSEGLTDGIIDYLDGFPRIRVINRSSVFRLSGEVDLKKIADELNVRSVVIGRLSEENGRLRVNIRLIDLRNEKDVWEKQYEVAGNDLLYLHQRISRDILHELPGYKGGISTESLERTETNSAIAYDAYVRGTYLWNRRNNEDFIGGAEYFRQAIAADPAFAKAYLGLANCYAAGSFEFIRTDEERVNMVLAAANQALDIDPTLGEAYATRGLMKAYYKWDWSGAEADYKKAIELAPNYATARQWYAELLAIKGRLDESLAEYSRALELAPLSLAIRTDFGITLHYAARHDEAIAHLKQSAQMDPAYPRTYTYLSEIYRVKGDFISAIDAFEQSQIIERADPKLLSEKIVKLKSALKSSGAKGFWSEMLQNTLNDGNAGFEEAMFHNRLGDTDIAFEYLEKAFAKHEASLVYLNVKHDLKSLRNDPRFTTIVRQMGL